MHVPVQIEDAVGVGSLDLKLTYDTTRLDLQNEDVLAGPMLAQGWEIVANVDDASGQLSIIAFPTGASLLEGQGTVLDLLFSIPASATGGPAPVTVSGELNEGQIPSLGEPGQVQVLVDPVTLSIPTDLSGYRGQMVHAPVHEDYRADVAAIEAAITPNTIMLVGSAPSYPQGVVDPIRLPVASDGVIHNGVWGNVPSGETYIAPVEGSAQGSIVINGSIPGMRVGPAEEIVLHFRDGRVTSIDPDHNRTAQLLKSAQINRALAADVDN